MNLKLARPVPEFSPASLASDACGGQTATAAPPEPAAVSWLCLPGWALESFPLRTYKKHHCQELAHIELDKRSMCAIYAEVLSKNRISLKGTIWDIPHAI